MVMITILISILSMILLSTLFYHVRLEAQSHATKQYRSQKEGFSDRLNYSCVVDDGVIVGKDGSFMAAWLYAGADSSSQTDKSLEMVSYRINQALSKMGSGWMIHVDAIRREAPGYSARERSNFNDPVSYAIDEERRALFESIGTLYEGYFIITLTWLPPILAEKRFVELMFDDDQKDISKKAKTEQLIESFHQACANFESKMGIALDLRRLKSDLVIDESGKKIIQDELLRYIQFCATGLNHPVNLPNTPIYLDALIGGQEFIKGVIPKVGRKFIQCVAIEGFPSNASPGLLTTLSQLPVSYRWNTRFIFMDQHEADAHFKKYQKKWKQKIRGFFDQVFNLNSGNIDQDALDMTQDASNAIAETNSGMVAQGYYTSVVVLMDEDRVTLEKSALLLEKSINTLGFTARVETMNTVDAFFGSLPSHGYENVRRPIINTMNLADLLPTSSIWTGENVAPNPMLPAMSPPLMHCVTSGNAPFRLNLHIKDLGHTIMFGPTRAGKSTHLAMIVLSWLRYKNARVYAFDKGLSMYPVCSAVGGKHFVIAGDNEKLCFAPLSFLESKSDRAWAMQWIDNLLLLNDVKTTPHQRNEIGHAILSMHESGAKTLSEFVTTIQDEQIREALKSYTIDGEMGELLDAESDGLELASIMTFEIEALMNLGDKYLLPILLYLFRRIEKSLDGMPTLIVLDEVWVMLSHIVFREKIKEWLNAMAKKNCTVVMATQHLTQARDSGILDVIAASTATKIFLPNMYATDPEISELYTRMGLNTRQIDIITNAVPKRDYYYVSAKGQRLYQLALGPKALAFAGKTDLDSIHKMQLLEKQYGREWPNYWLKEQGIKTYKEAA